MAATAFTAKVTLTYSDGSPSISGSVSTTADGITDRIVPLAAGATNIEVDIDFVYTRLKEMFLISTQDTTVKTNATTAVDTINLKANVPYWWSSSSGVTNPFTADVTRVFLVNVSGTLPAQWDGRFLYDSTP